MTLCKKNLAQISCILVSCSPIESLTWKT